MKTKLLTTETKVLDTYLNPKQCFRKKHFPILRQPKMAGYFSIDERRQFVPDASQLKYIKVPRQKNVYFDLNKGIEDYEPKPKDVIKEKMDFMLHFILKNMERLKSKGNQCNFKLLYPDVICSRGRLAQIMLSNHQSCNKNWSLLISKYKGNIYICQSDGEYDLTVGTMYGFKFEQYMMSESPLKEPNTDVPVLESEEFYCVFDNKIDNISLLYNAEMDGLANDVEVDLTKFNWDELRFTEVKTIVGTNYYLKYCKWWSQSTLAGVGNVTLGIRNREGIVTQIRSIPLNQLPRYAQGKWSPASSIDFLKSFLSFVQLAMRRVDCPKTVYKFDYDPKTHQNVLFEIFEGENKYSFLPSWYIEEINKQD